MSFHKIGSLNLSWNSDFQRNRHAEDRCVKEFMLFLLTNYLSDKVTINIISIFLVCYQCPRNITYVVKKGRGREPT